MSKLDRMIRHARKVALSGTGVGGNRMLLNYKLGAVIFDGPVLLATGVNSYKTHPYLLRYTEFPFMHAEHAAMFQLGLDGCSGKDMLVCRIIATGEFANAKPCRICQSLISKANLKRVYYTTGNGSEISLL